MIQHWMRFTNETSGCARMANHAKVKCVPKNGNPKTAWDTSRTCFNMAGDPGSVRVILVEAVYSDSVLVTPEILDISWIFIVALPLLDEDLRDTPGNACRCIWDGDDGTVLYEAPNLSNGEKAARIEPLFAGSVPPSFN